jgi:thymidylate synthase
LGVWDYRCNLSVFFRSWDIFAGLPENLGGLQMLKEYVLASLDESGHITDGHIIAYSDGAHIGVRGLRTGRH